MSNKIIHFPGIYVFAHFKPASIAGKGVFSARPFSGIDVSDIKLFLSNRPFAGGVLR
jgi:hypothetical protein